MTISSATRIGLIRHATTLWNEKKKIQGQLGSPLSAVGIQMAQSWGRELKGFPWQRIVSSDLERAKETTVLINKELDLPVIYDSRLREQDWGRWSGMTLAGVNEKDPLVLSKQVRSGWEFRPPGGESRHEVLQRTLKSLNEIHDNWPGENVLVVCHEGVIKCLLYHLLERKFLPEEPKVLKNFYLHLLVFKENNLNLEQVNNLALTGSID